MLDAMHNDLMDTLAVYCCCCFESASDLTNVTENGFVTSLPIIYTSKGYYTEFGASFTISVLQSIDKKISNFLPTIDRSETESKSLDDSSINVSKTAVSCGKP